MAQRKVNCEVYTDRGIVGERGADGADGKSAYQQAVEGGYQGTEEEFEQALASDIATVANNVTNINVVGNNIENINTAADNMAAIIAAPTAATQASASASQAATSATNAQTSETNAATSASNASTSASNASASATTASTKAGEATASATSASASAISASTSATSASTSAANAQKWAEGTDQQVTPLSGEHSAKGWAKVAKQYAESIDLSNYRTSADQDIIDATKQDTLVSGTNIKTVNGKSLLGSGNVDIDALPSQTGQSGKFLTTDGTDASWATVNALPSQTGQNGKFLTTDGTDASWAKVNIPEGVYTRDNLIEGNGIDFTDVTDIDSDTMLLLHCDGNLTDSSQYASDLYYANESSTISNIITTWNNTSKFGEKSLKLYYSSNSVKPIMRNPIFSSITSAFTLDFWCYFESGSRCYATIFNPSNQNIHFELYYYGGQKIIYFSDSNSHGGRMSSTVSSYANLNAWNHIAITYDGTTAKLFVNGTLAYSGTFTLDLTSGLLGFMPIAPGNTSTYGYPQNLDEIRLSKVLRWSSDFDVPTAPYGQPTGQTKINCGIDNKSVSLNSGDKIQTVGVIDQNDTTKAIKTWTGTRAQYDAIFIKDPDTTYNITDDTVLTDFANTSLSNLTNAGKIVGAGLGMPSGRYIDLTLGASGTTYTAPADGWVIVAKRCGNTGNNYMGIYSDTVLYHMENWAPASANGDAMCCIFFPVKKGHTFPITYSCTGATEVFRFIYAEGSKSEAN